MNKSGNLNQKGVSLIELLVVVGIMLLITGGTIRLVLPYTLKSQGLIHSQMSEENLRDMIKGLPPEACTRTFKGKKLGDDIENILSEQGVILSSSNTIFQRNLKIERYRFKPTSCKKIEVPPTGCKTIGCTYTSGKTCSGGSAKTKLAKLLIFFSRPGSAFEKENSTEECSKSNIKGCYKLVQPIELNKELTDGDTVDKCEFVSTSQPKISLACKPGEVLTGIEKGNPVCSESLNKCSADEIILWTSEGKPKCTPVTDLLVAGKDGEDGEAGGDCPAKIFSRSHSTSRVTTVTVPTNSGFYSRPVSSGSPSGACKVSGAKHGKTVNGKCYHPIGYAGGNCSYACSSGVWVKQFNNCSYGGYQTLTSNNPILKSVENTFRKNYKDFSKEEKIYLIKKLEEALIKSGYATSTNVSRYFPPSSRSCRRSRSCIREVLIHQDRRFHSLAVWR